MSLFPKVNMRKVFYLNKQIQKEIQEQSNKSIVDF